MIGRDCNKYSQERICHIISPHESGNVNDYGIACLVQFRTNTWLIYSRFGVDGTVGPPAIFFSSLRVHMPSQINRLPPTYCNYYSRLELHRGTCVISSLLQQQTNKQTNKQKAGWLCVSSDYYCRTKILMISSHVKNS